MVNILDLQLKESLFLRFTGEEIVVSFVSSEIFGYLEKNAEEKDYIPRICGYKNNEKEAFIQIYISVSNPEFRRKPRGRTTRRIVLEKEDIIKLANQFIIWTRESSDKIHIRVQASAAQCLNMREAMAEILENFFKANKARIELKNIRNYKDRKFETMDLEIL